MSRMEYKIKRLIKVANMYYIEDKTQFEIAKELGVSRPLISRMLTQAKEMGIVEIKINEDVDVKSYFQNNLEKYGIKGVAYVHEEKSDVDTNKKIAQELMELLSKTKTKNIGLGWGTILSEIAHSSENNNLVGVKNVFPLIGNSNVSNKNYHTNELVRIFAEGLNAKASYLYSPAFAETLEEMEGYKRISSFKKLEKLWSSMSVAIVNIGTYPSTPDFASAARFGRKLKEEEPVGRLLSYLYTQDGKILESDTDYAIQIPIETLKNCKTVIGVCSANITPQSLLGALRTGVMTHIVCPETATKKAIELDRL